LSAALAFDVNRSGIEKLVWITLVAVMAWVVVRFVQIDGKKLPVLGEVGSFSLTNQLGQSVSRESLKGRIWVANVIFSRCPTQCHRLSQQMSRLQNALSENGRVRLVSLTADPSFDTTRVLEAYGKRYGADPDHWWLLTGDKSELYRLAIKDLGFTVMENSTKDPKIEDLFIHSAFFAIVDDSGRLRAVVHGEKAGAEFDVTTIVSRLSREK